MSRSFTLASLRGFGDMKLGVILSMRQHLELNSGRGLKKAQRSKHFNCVCVCVRECVQAEHNYSIRMIISAQLEQRQSWRKVDFLTINTILLLCILKILTFATEQCLIYQSLSFSIDKTWKELAGALSGLLCVSFNFVDASNSLNPEFTFRPAGIVSSGAVNSSYLRYSTLPREIVCTENLTPWKKLLPCDAKVMK